MKSKLIYISSIFLLFVNYNIFAQREEGRRGASNPGSDPDALPVDDYLWVLFLVALIYAIIVLKSYVKPSVK